MASSPLRLSSIRRSFGAGHRFARRFSRQEGQEAYGRLRDPVFSRAGVRMRGRSGPDDPIGRTRGGEDESTVPRGGGHDEVDEFWMEDEHGNTEEVTVDRFGMSMRDRDVSTKAAFCTSPALKRAQSLHPVSSTNALRSSGGRISEGTDRSSRTSLRFNIKTPPAEIENGSHCRTNRYPLQDRPVEFTLGGTSLNRSFRFSSRRLPSQSAPSPQCDVTRTTPRDVNETSGYPLFLSRDDLSSDSSYGATSSNGDTGGDGGDSSGGAGGGIGGSVGGSGGVGGATGRTDMTARWRLYRSESELSDDPVVAGDSGLGTSGEETDESLGGPAAFTLHRYTSRELAAERAVGKGKTLEEKGKEGEAWTERETGRKAKRDGVISKDGSQTGKLPGVFDSVRKMKSSVKKLLKVT